MIDNSYRQLWFAVLNRFYEDLQYAGGSPDACIEAYYQLVTGSYNTDMFDATDIDEKLFKKKCRPFWEPSREALLERAVLNDKAAIATDKSCYAAESTRIRTAIKNLDERIEDL